MSAELDALLGRAGLTVTPQEHERLERYLAVVHEQNAELRIAEARDAEPAMTFAPHSRGTSAATSSRAEARNSNSDRRG